MNKLIEFHRYSDGEPIWIRDEIIIAVEDQRLNHDRTCIYAFAGKPLYFCVNESPEEVVNAINKLSLQK